MDINRFTQKSQEAVQAAQTKALPLGELFRTRIASRSGHDDVDEGESLQIYRPRYAWFLGASLLLLAMEMILGRRRAVLVA